MKLRKIFPLADGALLGHSDGRSLDRRPIMNMEAKC